MTRRSTSHDQWFKDLLRSFFDQLIELVAPDLVAELDLDTVTFLEQELFSDLPQGERSIADLVAKVATRRGDPKLVLFHGEIEGAFRQSTAQRLWRYSLHLILKYKLPVASLVIFLKGGQGGLRRERLIQTVGQVETHAFSYYALGLAGSDAREYLAKPQELAWSLAALMHPGDWDRPRHKLACWQRLVHARVDPARHFLLSNLVETYVKLDDGEQMTFERCLEEVTEREEVRAMQMTWAEELELKGLERGLEQGRYEGMRTLLVRLLEHRFGALPRRLVESLDRLDEPDRLQKLADQILDAKSLDELDF